MTVNERLFASGLLDSFDYAVAIKDVDKLQKFCNRLN
ncbi:MAG: hypothetical protein K0R65_855 [Crocinitomicaceae bacterium]|jgi:hypothetical protein|nr:hypothetical protein [Crocinitomicaceae bacterium]